MATNVARFFVALLISAETAAVSLQGCFKKFFILKEKLFYAVLSTYATFSATAPLVGTEKGGARRGGAKVKNKGAVAVARKKWRLCIRAFSTPFSHQILHRN